LVLPVSLFEGEADRRLVNAVAGRAVLVFAAGTVGIMSVLLLGVSGGPRLTATTSLPHGLGYLGLFGSTILMLRVIVAVARDRAA